MVNNMMGSGTKYSVMPVALAVYIDRGLSAQMQELAGRELAREEEYTESPGRSIENLSVDKR
jgi:hypothetical protein